MQPIHPDIGYRIKMYTLCTQSHRILHDNYFLPSIKDDFEIIVSSAEQACESASFFKEGWTETMLAKVNVIIRAIKENMGKIFVFSDVDIQYFKKIEPYIVELIKNKDFIVQRGHPKDLTCAGFFVCRGNNKTLQLWEEIKKMMIKNPSLDDQRPLNTLLQTNPFGLRWAVLPTKFYHCGILTSRSWKPGVILKIPHNIVLHHACFTVGIDNKIALLEYVKQEYQSLKEKN